MKLLRYITLLLILGFTKLIACGYSYSYTFVQNESYNFLDPSLIDLTEDNPLYSLSRSRIYGYGIRVQFFNEKSQALNVQEWQNYFSGTLTKGEIEKLFYANEDSLLKRYDKLSSQIDNESFDRYLRYVASQELNVGYDNDKIKISSKLLIEQGEKYLIEEEDNFLKLRYLFLIMRLNHYSKHYEKTLALYDKYYPKVKDVNSVVVEWIDALRAGALQHLGRDVESNLLYGKILKHNKSNAYLGYYDFKIENDIQWKNLLAQTQTAEHKALFYFLRALKWDGMPLLEHRELAKIAPNSVWFERLTYLVMQEFQSRYLDENSIDKNDKYERLNYKSYLEQKAYFLNTLTLLKNPSFFSLYSKLYLDIKEQKNPQEIPKQFKRLNTLANTKQKEFVDMLSYINGVRAITDVKKGKNEALFNHLTQLLKEAPASKRESIFAYTAHYMAKLYPKNSAEERFSKHCSVLQNSEGYYGSYLEGHMDILRAKDFERYVEKKDRNIYEQKVFRVVMSSLAKNDVAKFLTILYTKDGDFKKANYYMKQVPELNRKTNFNPFNVSLSGNNRKLKGKGYTQRKFVETMLKIRQVLDKNPSSAMDHYLYANGLYNSSWFGNFPMLGSINRSVTGFTREEGEHILDNFKNIEHEYKLAEKHASNPEFKAKIAYQLLKIDYNRFLIKSKESKYGVYVGFFKAKSLTSSKDFALAIAKYKEQYGRTKYGKEIIKKCATFRYFK